MVARKVKSGGGATWVQQGEGRDALIRCVRCGRAIEAKRWWKHGLEPDDPCRSISEANAARAVNPNSEA